MINESDSDDRASCEKDASSPLREWSKPQITRLALGKTESGQIDAQTEGSWWVFTWGPPQS